MQGKSRKANLESATRIAMIASVSARAASLCLAATSRNDRATRSNSSFTWRLMRSAHSTCAAVLVNLITGMPGGDYCSALVLPRGNYTLQKWAHDGHLASLTGVCGSADLGSLNPGVAAVEWSSQTTG
jgi:hypothetical protein